MDFYRILYSSKASDAMKSSDVMNIIATAQAFNKTADVTGMLLFIEDGFIQYLEGAEETVVKLYKKIAQDSRHQDCKVLLQGPSGEKERSFASWNMGLKIITDQDFQDLKAMNENPDFNLFNELEGKPDIAKELMKYFYNHGEIDFGKFWNSDNKIRKDI